MDASVATDEVLIAAISSRKNAHIYRTEFEDDKKDLHVNMISIPLAEAGPEPVATGSANKTKAQSQPANQHTKKPGPGSRKN